ncbi:hypothetical protein KDI_17300 [Dictyobacter arantiisoli]|uniref:Uncharacterized protein n=1 Tax=Dictyobacter arantiisoli TaxID=2014874 RepID=A0A5A5TAI4_9CHLR|nr:hypothetical protein KDI_17300 [Dictyobacter arantiisoli]
MYDKIMGSAAKTQSYAKMGIAFTIPGGPEDIEAQGRARIRRERLFTPDQIRRKGERE